MSKLKLISAVFAVVIGLSTVVGVGARLDGRYARASELSRVADDLDRHVIEVRMKVLQERLWAIEDRWTRIYKEDNGGIPRTLKELLDYMTPEARQQYRELQAEYDDMERALDDTDDRSDQ